MMKIMPVDDFRPEDFKTPPIQAGNEIEQKVDAIIQDVRASKIYRFTEAGLKEAGADA